MNKQLNEVNLVARVTLAFIYIYHGLVPKILWLSPVEKALAEAHNMDPYYVSPLAGIAEILLGISLLILRSTLIPVYLVILSMVALLLDVMVVMPELLIEAFNPVSSNIACIALAMIVLKTHSATKSH